jgi:hypothetical protein
MKYTDTLWKNKKKMVGLVNMSVVDIVTTVPQRIRQ